MMRNNHTFMWSNNWYIEDDKGWFIDGRRDILCCLDFKSDQCEFVMDLPNAGSNRFQCIKIKNEIFCMPGISGCIWIYNLDDSHFSKIEIENPNNDRLSISSFWEYEDKLFALSKGLKKVIEIDIKKKVIDNYHIICSVEEEKIEENIRVDSEIYCVSTVSNRIYMFDLKAKETMVYTIPKVEGGLYAISYDGYQFWLSGYRKEIYIWNKENNSTKILKDFPEQFGIYNLKGDSKNFLDCRSIVYDIPVFIEIRALGQYIWFIPFQTNKIIYVDRDTHEIYTLEIENEDENVDSLMSRPLSHKYLLEYVRDDRYIGLFSLKNSYILEIDTEKKKTERKEYILSNKYLSETLRICGGWTLYENDGVDKKLYESLLLDKGREGLNKKTNNVGLKIYEALK